jgi:tetratricopeptide (TPR) repeat protein
MAGTYNNLGSTYEKQGDFAAAEHAYAKARDLQVERLGPQHQEVAICLNNLGRAAQLQGKTKDAEKFYLHSLEIKEKALDASHPSLGLTYSNLGDLYRTQELWAKAEVTPISWTPEHLCCRSPQWQERNHLTRRSSGVR